MASTYSILTVSIQFTSSAELGRLILKSRLNPDEMNIVEWASSGSDQNVFWLHGVAGSGKSTVSMTVADRFRAISCLGAHLFFQRGKSEPSSVIRTLASFDASIAKHVLAAIEQDNDIALAAGTTQFLTLVNEPLIHCGEAMRGPVIIVLDALDECGTSTNQQSLLEVLREGFPVLPKNFRFLITSRKELDIDRALSSRPESVYAVELEHDSTSCKDDITDDWRLKMDRLGDAAGGLFVWASTAVKLIDRDYPSRRLNDLVSQSQSLSGLNNLYRTILDTSGISFDDKISKGNFSQVLSLILLCKITLSDGVIDGILGYPDEESSRLVLSRLQSVLVYIPGAPVRICHSSFCDYLLAPERECDNWYIDLESQKLFLVTRCFGVMKDGLRFNICGIDSSHLFNDQIPDLPDRVRVNIPLHLEYACLFWAQHLREVQFSPALLSKLSEFLNKCFLYWLEVMSLLGKIGIAGQALLHVMNWISNDHCIFAFYFAIDTSHLRVCPSQLGVKERSPLLKKLTGHTAVVTAVAFSLDGTRIASGSSDMTIRVWDAESGRIISGPFAGHTSSIRSVAFSPDGTLVVSGSSDRAIRIWDVESGRVISGPLTGHTSWVYSVAFSPDGKLVVSGSADKTILIWNVDGGHARSGPFKGHSGSVRSVAFSHDSKRIVSGSDDKTIRIWNAKSGQTIYGPLEGHAGHVMSVAFSRDARRVVSGSVDRTIRVWNAETGQCISGPLIGHTSVVCSVAFLPDDERVISGSDDRTVRTWYIESRQTVSIPFEGHSLNFLSIAFSPDGTRVVSGAWDCTIRIWDAENNMGHGKCVASGSDDRTIRVWDTESGEMVSGSFKGHKDAVRTVSFSPDGTHVVSSSEDKTLRMWDVKSGQMSSGPFEGHKSSVRSVAFSPDGRRVVSGSLDKTIILWDVESGNVISGTWRGHTDSVLSVAFSSDSTRVVSGSADTTILVWNVASGQVVVGPFKGHTKVVRSVVFSPDRTRVASGSSDRTVRVWDAETGQAMFAPLEGHTGSARSVTFSPDGRRIVSGSWDRTIKMWNIEDPVFDWTLDKDGWIRGREGELLLWIPPYIRPTLWRTQNTAVFNCAFSTKLDFTNAALGKRWQEGFARPE
ncbi:WD40 repeat-like protein [Fomitiporia mediterranea MF3/22]|uniref:WD40 repeat-like protein n=1 Tax=Fomitiporia mediterranea (strain MF3/22) TaxID=694068 RepID=UPI0004407F51|nr:WD40 repeat-like protein [Fomitiporia mediterranea MF3/22]EJC98406.1 WD40 repeat-like protein [Fomitiporia mediterranea MF3/22]